MALGTETTVSNGNTPNWREVVSAIKEAGKVLDKEIDPQSLRYPALLPYNLTIFFLDFHNRFCEVSSQLQGRLCFIQGDHAGNIASNHCFEELSLSSALCVRAFS